MECYGHSNLEDLECGDTRITVQSQSKMTTKSTVEGTGSGQGNNLY